jgi:hypothetical protein
LFQDNFKVFDHFLLERNFVASNTFSVVCGYFSLIIYSAAQTKKKFSHHLFVRTKANITRFISWRRAEMVIATASG